MKELTEKQHSILRFIQNYTDDNKCPPTVREIATAFSISIKAVQDHLTALKKKGYVSHTEKRSRGLRVLIDDRPEANLPKSAKIPLLGTIAAGKPIFADENFEGYVPFSKDMLPPDHDYFALRVRGTSMIGAGILDGDIAIIQQCSTARNGQIVVALIDDSVTLKRYFNELMRIRLQPENPEFKPIYSQNVTILGILSSIIRNY